MLFSLKIKPLKTLKKKKKIEFTFFIHTNLYPRPTI